MCICPDVIVQVSVQSLVPVFAPMRAPLCGGYVLGQLQRGLLQMATSLGPVSSVRVVGGQEVSEARPALPAEALGLTREASSLRMAGGG